MRIVKIDVFCKRLFLVDKGDWGGDVLNDFGEVDC